MLSESFFAIEIDKSLLIEILNNPPSTDSNNDDPDDIYESEGYLNKDPLDIELTNIKNCFPSLNGIDNCDFKNKILIDLYRYGEFPLPAKFKKYWTINFDYEYSFDNIYVKLDPSNNNDCIQRLSDLVKRNELALAREFTSVFGVEYWQAIIASRLDSIDSLLPFIMLDAHEDFKRILKQTKLVDIPVEIKYCGSTRLTKLNLFQLAACCNATRIVEALLDSEKEIWKYLNQPIKYCNNDYTLPLLHACISCEAFETFKLLFNQYNCEFPIANIWIMKDWGKDIEINGPSSLLHHAVREGKERFLEYLLAQDKIKPELDLNIKLSMPSSKYTENNSLLHLAVDSKKSNIVDILLKNAKIKQVFWHENNNNESALYFAAWSKVDSKPETGKILDLMLDTAEELCNSCNTLYKVIELFKFQKVSESRAKEICNHFIQSNIGIISAESYLSLHGFLKKAHSLINEQNKVLVASIFNQKIFSLLGKKRCSNNPSSSLECFELYKQLFDYPIITYLNLENREGLDTLHQKKLQALQGIKKEQWKFIEPPCLDIQYSCSNLDPKLNSNKTISCIAFQDIHRELSKQHDIEYAYYTSVSKKTTTNFILAHLTIICSDQEWRKKGSHGRHFISFPIKGNNVCYHNDSKDSNFLISIAKRLMNSGDIEKSAVFLQSVYSAGKNYEISDQEWGRSYFDLYYMHSEQALYYFLSSPQGIELIITELQKHGIKAGFKIYGLILDVRSTNSPCDEEIIQNSFVLNSCKSTLFGFQNSHNDPHGFLNLLRKRLDELSYSLPRKKKVLPFITRYSAIQTHKNHKPGIIDNNSSFDLNKEANSYNDIVLYKTDFAGINHNNNDIGNRKYSIFVSGSVNINYQLPDREPKVIPAPSAIPSF